MSLTDPDPPVVTGPTGDSIGEESGGLLLGFGLLGLDESVLGDPGLGGSGTPERGGTAGRPMSLLELLATVLPESFLPPKMKMPAVTAPTRIRTAAIPPITRMSALLPPDSLWRGRRRGRSRSRSRSS